MTVPISHTRTLKLRVALPPAHVCTACRDRTWILGFERQGLCSSMLLRCLTSLYPDLPPPSWSQCASWGRGGGLTRSGRAGRVLLTRI